MKAYKITILIVDHDEIGINGAVDVLHNTRYPNHCISPHVMQKEVVDIGEWHDGHPLNHTGKMVDEFRKIFKDPPLNMDPMGEMRVIGGESDVKEMQWFGRVPKHGEWLYAVAKDQP